MSDLVEMLRKGLPCQPDNVCKVMHADSCFCTKAADEIERLEKAREMDASDARQALEEISRLEKENRYLQEALLMTVNNLRSFTEQ